eukprot:6869523-Lingulodinium_polyedra.AAC.1
MVWPAQDCGGLQYGRIRVWGSPSIGMARTPTFCERLSVSRTSLFTRRATSDERMSKHQAARSVAADQKGADVAN